MSVRLGYGTKLKLGDGNSPEAFASIGKIVGGPSRSRSTNEVEVTGHDSPAFNGLPVQEYIGGAVNMGEIQFTVNKDTADATHDRSTGILSVVGQTRNFRLEEPGNSTGYEFSALVRDVDENYDPTDPMTIAITLRVKSADTEYAIT